MNGKLNRIIIIITVLGCIVGVIMYEASKIETPPFWFDGNQLDWEMRHYQTPVGADEISQYIINNDGLKYLAWDRTSYTVLNYNADQRRSWEGEKLLVRYLNGKAGLFSGGGTLHQPLSGDPRELKKQLRECLDPTDNGKILATHQKEHLTITEAIEASGGKVVKPK